MARLLKIWTVLLFTLCAVLLADEGNSVQTTGRKLADGGILLPRSWGDYYPVEMHFTEI